MMKQTYSKEALETMLEFVIELDMPEEIAFYKAELRKYRPRRIQELKLLISEAERIGHYSDVVKYERELSGLNNGIGAML